MRIFLIGFMGSGKSYVGRRLANTLQCAFLDLDALIEQKEGASVREIFSRKGEAYFRQVERQVLQQTGAHPNAVIACGGGTPCFFDNLQWMKGQGLTVYLSAGVDVLTRRLRAQQEQRPLLGGLDEPALRAFIEEKLAEREPFYRQASIAYHQQSGEEDAAGELAVQFKGISGR